MAYLFIALSAVVGYGIVWRIPKRLTLLEMYTTSLFAVLVNTLFDVYLDLEMGLYGYFDKGADWGMLLAIPAIFPPANILYLNFYPFGQPVLRHILYIAAWTGFALGYEALALSAGLLYYHGWRLAFSLFVYPPAMAAAALHLKFLRWLRHRPANP
ncbi:CBO0543 family protein [Alicyclobacillus sp.]|uniref:CBO0543 family protein n=1 Tax=Alicyclobacillus sp. TaxID=61169 RepID=UPI0025C5EBBF|nr:CBO0543 family protein [Alicyclobacillus sp.]MCL6517269.1 hypothetical protein [Alicyclobacillus sp.]